MATVDGSLHQRLIGLFFRYSRIVKPVRERVTIGEKNDRVEREHLARYHFAKQYCKGLRVADIACGTGYGSEILRQTATSVDGYDREALCGNTVLDLERESWGQSYDLIVSFETIEHLANPEFFLDNVQATQSRLIVSTPVGELRGYNPHHKQVWTLPEFLSVLKPRFESEVFYQRGEIISREPEGVTRFVIAVCKPKKQSQL